MTTSHTPRRPSDGKPAGRFNDGKPGGRPARGRRGPRPGAADGPQDNAGRRAPARPPLSEGAFFDMGIDARICANLPPMGLNQPTPIQAEAIPAIAKGRDLQRARAAHDVLAGQPPVAAPAAPTPPPSQPG